VDEFERVREVVIEKLLGLSSKLTYHCLDHTLDVVDQADRIARDEQITNTRDLFLLKVAALYHDTGFLKTYIAHEEKSCEIFMNDSAAYNLTEEEKTVICKLIMSTQIPQCPVTMLEKIICDADLDYLGRDDFFSVGNQLREEFLSYKIVTNNDEWEYLQMKFLQDHQYHTRSSKSLRESAKQDNFAKLA
jgi:uncharacterized protein